MCVQLGFGCFFIIHCNSMFLTRGSSILLALGVCHVTEMTLACACSLRKSLELFRRKLPHLSL